MDAPIAILVALALVGLYPSVDLAASLSNLWRILLGVSIFYGLVNTVTNHIQLRRITLLFIVGCLGVALLTLMGTDWGKVRLVSLPQVYGLFPALVHDIDDAQSFNPRIMGMALATIFPIPLSVLLFGEDRIHRGLSGVAVLGMGIVLTLTQSLPAMAGTSVALLFLAGWRVQRILFAVPLVIGILILGCLTYGPTRIGNMLLSLDNPFGIGVVLRLDMWGQALAMIRDMPYTGIGLNTFPVVQSNFYPGFLLGPEPHAHNLFLQVALDTGLLGLAAFLWLMISCGSSALEAYRLHPDKGERALVVGVAAGLLSHFVMGTVDTMWTAKPGVLLWILLGLMATLSQPMDRPVNPSGVPERFNLTKKPPAWLLALGALVPILLVSRSTLDLNLGILQAHKGIMQSRLLGLPAQEDLGTSVLCLRQGLIQHPDNAHAYSLLGTLSALEGDFDTALGAFERRVALDGVDPIGRYAPFEAIRRFINHQDGYDRWDDLLRVYGQWIARFPTRAETYVLAAVVWHRYKGDSTRAAAVIRSGLDHGAQPAALLSYYLLRIGQGKPSR